MRLQKTSPFATGSLMKNLPPKLEQVAIVVIDGKFPHAVLKALDGVANPCLVFQLLPERSNVVTLPLRSFVQAWASTLEVSCSNLGFLRSQ